MIFSLYVGGGCRKNLKVNIGSSSDQLVDNVGVSLLARQGQGGEALLSHTVGVHCHISGNAIEEVMKRISGKMRS